MAEATAESPRSDVPKDALKKAAKGRKISTDEAQDALEWLLAAGNDPERAVEPTTLHLNLGSKDEPQRIKWEIVPVEDTKINAIRDGARKGNRRQRRRTAEDAEVDEMLVARRIVVEGTVSPPVADLAKHFGLADPADAVHAFFARAGKTGLITQISGEILSISGWDDEDLEEVEAARG